MTRISRRTLLRGGAALVAAPSVTPSRAAQTLGVLDSGGAWQAAARLAWYDPFEKETGVRVVAVSGITSSAAQLKLLVQSGRKEVSVINLGVNSMIAAGREGLLQPLDYNVIKTANFLPGSTYEFGLGTQRSGNLLIYNRETYPSGKSPEGVADFWDKQRFAGRRALGDLPTNMLEFALVADGVPKEKLYPIDYERAFRKLDEIKSAAVWWTTYSRQTQFLVDKEVDLQLGSVARAQAAIDEGAPYNFVWNDVMLNLEGWGIPKGADRTLGLEFIAFAADARRQAQFCERMAAGPVDRDAFRYIDPERAKVLPTYPDILKTAFFRDETYYADHQQEMFNKWTEWRAK